MVYSELIKPKFKVNDEIQTVAYNISYVAHITNEGTILEVINPVDISIQYFDDPKFYHLSYGKRAAHCYTYKVKWKSGKEEIATGDNWSCKDTDLERQFREVCLANKDKIALYLEEANYAIQKACEIAEAAGIPFQSDVSQLSQPYCPTSFKAKFPNLDYEAASNISGAFVEEYSSGWANSVIC